MELARKPIQFQGLTEEQQRIYEGLPPQQRAYVENRVRGMDAANAYRAAGYSPKNAAQAAHLMEKRNPALKQVVDILVTEYSAASVYTGAKGDGLRDVAAIAKQKSAKSILETIKKSSPEQAKSIKFYSDVASGKERSIQEVFKVDANGQVTGREIRRIKDVKVQMEAQKQLDMILHTYDHLQVVDTVKTATNVIINIVNAKKEEEDESKEIDGEIVEVTESDEDGE